MDGARDAILNDIRRGLRGRAVERVSPLPASARVPSRVAGSTEGELDRLLAMIQELGGKTRRLTGDSDVDIALAELVRDEAIKRATICDTAELRELQIPDVLERLGVELVPAYADKRDVAACDVGITGVDAALAESGTLALVSSQDQPAITSLLPRIHLALMRPTALRADLRELLGEFAGKKHFTLISGASRTTDIEKVLALGVHGPKELYVWCLE